MNPVAEQALSYLRRDWRVIPVHARHKRPVHDDWPKLRIGAADVERYFGADSNIGVVLGDVSGGLADVDLDCPEALALADRFLPPTAAFGRPSKPRSHRLYCSRGATTEKFSQPLGGGKQQMLVELRANKLGAAEGLQTVFPRSVHPSGEAIEWSDLRPVASIAPEALRRAVARLASAVVLVRLGWPLARAVAAVETQDPGVLLDAPDAAYALVARWLGLPTRAPRPAPVAQPARTDNRLRRASAYLAKIPGAISGSGGHQTAWTAALSVVRGFDLSAGEAFALLASEYNPRCNPPWSERELAHKVADAAQNARAERGYLLRAERPQAGRAGAGAGAAVGAGANGAHRGAAPAAAGSAPEWEPPIEFDTFDLPPFPADALPPPIADFVRALAEATQTPVDLPGMLALAACSAAAAKRVLVEVRPGYREPLNVFVAVVLPPGERKSAVVKEISAPLIEWEANAAKLLAPQINRASQQWAMSKKRLDAVTDRAAKAKRKEEREQLEMEALELGEQHAQIHVPQEPRILADDATPEALASLLALHEGRMAMFSAEGGVFTMMAGKYSDSPSLDVYLKAHAGDEIRVDRKGRPSERIADPALTLGLAVQPSVLEALAEKPMLRGTGLLARFLYAMPTSMLGSRKIHGPPIPDSVREAYQKALRSILLMQQLKQPIVFKFAADAYDAWCDFAAWVEPQLAEFGALESIRDWASKLAGAVARLSGVLRIFSTFSLKIHSEDHPSILIQVEDVVRASMLGRYLVPHAQAAISSMGADRSVDAAQHVLRCLRRKAWPVFTRSQLQQSVRRATLFDEATRLDQALRLLEERRFIRRQVSQPAGGPGRPSSTAFEVNPLTFETAPINPEYPDNRPRSHSKEREPGEDDD